MQNMCILYIFQNVKIFTTTFYIKFFLFLFVEETQILNHVQSYITFILYNVLNESIW